jgi:hypothetical protein
MEWVNVKDRLPENDGRYLTLCRSTYGGVLIRETLFNNKFGWIPVIDNVKFSHWMPLPDKPKD